MIWVFSMLSFTTKRSQSSLLHIFAFLKVKTCPHIMHSYLQMCVKQILLYGRKQKLSVCLFVFPQKREYNLLCHPAHLSEAWFFSLVSGQIISSYLLLCMACKYDQLCHFIRHNPFQMPGEPVSTDDFHSSGKAVSYQSASVPAYRAWRLQRKLRLRLLSKLQNGS